MNEIPRWSKAVLQIAAVYNILWGAWVICFPTMMWRLVDIPAPEYLMLWQCIGMIVGVYGVGYWIAASDPVRHWPIILVGFLGKVFGPIGFAYHLYIGTLPPLFGVNILFNDLIWWVPFALILMRVWRLEKLEKTSWLEIEAKPHGT